MSTRIAGELDFVSTSIGRRSWALGVSIHRETCSGLGLKQVRNGIPGAVDSQCPNSQNRGLSLMDLESSKILEQTMNDHPTLRADPPRCLCVHGPRSLLPSHHPLPRSPSSPLYQAKFHFGAVFTILCCRSSSAMTSRSNVLSSAAGFLPGCPRICNPQTQVDSYLPFRSTIFIRII